MHTTKLRNGTEVLAWPHGGPKKYSNRPQATKVAAKIGGRVYHPFPESLCFYVRPPNQGNLVLNSDRNVF